MYCSLVKVYFRTKEIILLGSLLNLTVLLSPFFWKIFVRAFLPAIFFLRFSLAKTTDHYSAKKLLYKEQSLNFLSFETRHRFEGFTEENLQQKERANTVKNESNILGSSHFGKLIKNLKNHGVECRCRAGDIHGE